MKLNKKINIIISLILIILAVSFWVEDRSPEPKALSVNDNKTHETVKDKETKNQETKDETKQSGKDSAQVKKGNNAKESDSKDTSTKDSKTTTSKKAPSKTTPSTKKDKYQTDPVPSDKPKPVEPQENKKEDKVYTAHLSVSVHTVVANMDKLQKNKHSLVPKDGFIFKKQTIEFKEGESVFEVLEREMRKAKIHMEFSFFPVYNSSYIKGINNIYEFDGGPLSGWMYKVNGWFPNYGASRFELKQGDVIEWVYTLDLGKDVGGEFVEQ